MIPAVLLSALPTGTTFLDRSDGFQLALASGAIVRVTERIRPLAAARAVVKAVRDRLGFSTPHGNATVDLETHEGELAARHDVVENDRALSLGVVYGDDFYRLIVGIAAGGAPQLQRLVQQLTLELPLGLAARRLRRYTYTPPPGWALSMRHRLIAEWFAPGFPNERAILTVFPARPYDAVPTDAEAFDRELHETSSYSTESISGPDTIVVSPSLAGVRWRLVGASLDRQRVYSEIVVVHDGMFQYMVRLDHDNQSPAVHRRALDELVHTIRPLSMRSTGPEAAVYIVD